MTNLDNNINPSDIRVTVETEYLANQSTPDENQFAFAYHITITNDSSYGVVLMHRHWIIIDANDQRQEVKGAGVIGEQPLIPTNTKFKYSSGTVLNTPIGTMQGSYQMVDEFGGALDVPIEPFLLALPNQVH
ncbi:Co2+/Mg2+ efflux protein ApaG [Porticoccaceae bacterium]|jgi:ApaG protein|nr:Co2+/Mg2+ efflux protein ApaG [Porticoccaceae bacterium]MDA9569656.1 Co2+/Mg2+ efflux protein ApaG [Porticoccaceae bacterium]